MLSKFIIYVSIIFILIIYNIINHLHYDNYIKIKVWHKEITKNYYYHKIGYGFIDFVRLGVYFIYNL